MYSRICDRFPAYIAMELQVGRKYLPEDIFGLEVRKDILHKVVRWHRAKKQQVTPLF